MSDFWENVDAGRIQLIAELGNAHLGSTGYACRLVERCLEAGADVVKFQSRSLPADVPDAKRTKVGVYHEPRGEETYLEYREGCELLWDVLLDIARRYPGKIGVSMFEHRFRQYLAGSLPTEPFAFLKAPSSVPIYECTKAAGFEPEHRLVSSLGGPSRRDCCSGTQHLYLVCASRYPSYQVHTHDAMELSQGGVATGLSLHTPKGVVWEKYAQYLCGHNGWRPLAVEVHVGPQVGTDSACTHDPHEVFPALRRALGYYAVMNHKTEYQVSRGL